MRSQQWFSRTVAAGLAAAALAVWTPGCNEGPTANNDGIGPEGGVVTSLDGRATLTIPAGALDRRIPITIRKVDDTQFLGDATYIGGTAYEVLPANLVFKKEVQLRIAFDAGNVPGDVTFDRLRIMDREQSAWSDEDCVYKGLSGNAVTAGMTHTNVFGVVAAPPVVASVTVSPKTALFEEGDQVQLTAAAKDAAGKGLSVAFTWTSSNPAVATVTNGMVTGLTSGTTTITVTAGAFSDVAEVTVHPKVVFIEILPFQAPMLLGTQQQFAARGEGPNEEPVVPAWVWSSNNLSVATVDPQTGLVTAVGLGEVDITVTFKAVTASVEFLVVGPVASVTVTPKTAKFEEGDAVQLTAVARDAAGQQLDETIDWSSSDPSVATVANGLVTGLAAGTATITATSGAFSDQAVVTVHPRVVFIEILGPTTPLLLGTQRQFTARAEGPNEEPVEPAFVWSSNNTSVATVDQNGLVTAVGVGEVDITVTFKSVTASVEFMVVGPKN